MRPVFIFLSLIIFCSSLTISAGTLSLSIGKGMEDTLIQSGNISSTDVRGFMYQDVLSEDLLLLDYNFDLFLEIATYQLKGRHLGLNEEMNIHHIKPKLRWSTGHNMHLDIGLGYARLSKTHWEEIDFTGHDFFALSFAAGWRFGERGQYSMDLVYNHYSNGYTRSPNPGLDFVTLNLGYVF